MRHLWLLALLASPSPPPVAADYQLCTTVHNAPLRAQRHVNGAAPVADIA